MIRPKLFSINLDLKNRNYITDIIVSQGDQLSNVFRFNLVQDSLPYDLTSLSVKAYIERPDKFTSFITGQLVDAVKGVVDVELTNQILNTPGVATCQVMIIGTAGELLSSLKISFVIEKSVNYTAIESTDEYNALIDAMSDVQSIKNDFDTVIANATVDSEVILARGDFLTLKQRLDASDVDIGSAEGRLDEVEAYVDNHEERIDAIEFGKVDKIEGKQLSTENYSTDEKNKLATIESGATGDMTALEIKTLYESNDDTNSYTDTEKNKVSNLPEDTNAELNDKAQKLKATNLVTNGDFSQGTTGWYVIGTAQITDKLSIIAGAVPSGVTKLGGLTVGNKYCIGLKVSQLSGGNGTRLFRVTYDSSKYVSFSNLSDGIFTDIYQSTISDLKLWISQISDNWSIDNIVLIDLTTTFGAGNEPTKEQMGRLLAEFQNSWFEGAQEILPLKVVPQLLEEKANKEQEAWITPTLLNGYTAGSFGTPQYMIDNFGFVHFRGSLTGGTPGQKAFDIIEGYRPPTTKIWVSTAGYNNFNTGFISTNGSFATNRVGVTGETGLDQICYKVGA